MKKRILIGLIVLVLLAAAGGGGYWAYTRYFAQAKTAQAQTLQTATVSRGDIVLTVDGTGNLLPATEKAVAFRVSGVLAELKVKVGDRVKAGDVLARLETLPFENAVRDATYPLEQARLDLQKAQRDVESGTSLEVAKKNLEAAKLGLTNAQGNYASALLNSNVTGDLQMAKFWADYWASDLGDKWLALKDNPNSDSKRIQYEEAGARSANAAAKLKQISQEAQNNLTAAKRSVVSAQQAYLSAQAAYSETLSSNAVQEAELAVLQKETALTQAQADLAYTALTAPVTGTVTEITADVGDSVGTSSILTLVDMETPLLRFWVEESDLSKVVVGNRVNIVFEAWPDETFTGKIIRVDPALVTEGNTQAVQAWASLDRPSQPVTFFSGMTAEVEVIAQETRNALLVPLEAVRELAAGQSAIFVVKPDGTLELRWVQVGLKDYVNAEILSGVNADEVVSLGTATRSAQSTRSTQSTRSSQPQGMGGPPPGEGGVFIFQGGGGR